MARRRPWRVAFTHISRAQWVGGYNYQLNLFTALARHCPDAIAPVLFAGRSAPAADLAPFEAIPGVMVVQSPVFDRRHAGLLLALTAGADWEAVRAFETAGIDVVLESARFFGWRLPIPGIAWLPDFQHLRLPALFSATARWRREIGFRMQIASGRSILLSSRTALSDFRSLYPRASNPVSVARFATEPPSGLLTADAASVVREYDLPECFFYLPNQFSLHKNHRLVLEALTILKKRGADIVVAASGSRQEARGKDNFNELMKEVTDRGIDAQFRYLGLIPLEHVYALLRTSRALINPSRFEGWSTTVEEAKSFGVPMILSDIPVHREQAGEQASYFNVDDADALARCLLLLSQASAQLHARDLVPGLDARAAAFAADFVETVEKCTTRQLAGQLR